jgi:hypothetical protein
MSRRPAVAFAILLSALAVAWWVTRPEPPTDEARIATLLEEAAQAAERKDASAAVAGVSEAFRGQGLDRLGLKQLVAFQAFQGRWRSVRPAGIRVRVDGDRAGAAFGLVLARSGPGTALADLAPSQASCWRVEAALAREPEGWRVTGATWRAASLAEALEAR